MFTFKKEFNFLPLSISFDFSLRHKILSGKLPFKTKFPFIKELSNKLGLSERVVKDSYKRLSDDGYITTVKKGGSYVSYKSDKSIRDNYNKNFISFQNIIQSMQFQGFNNNDIFACFYNAFYDIKNHDSNIIFVEENIFDLIQGKEELEDKLNTSLQAIPLYFFKKRYKNFTNKIIVTTFKNFRQVKNISEMSNIFPLKITPSLEEFINFNEIPSTSVIVYVTTSDENKRTLSETYKYIKENFKDFHIITHDEYYDFSLTPDIVIGTKQVFKIIEPIADAAKIILDRFYDNEGISLIKEKLYNYREI